MNFIKLKYKDILIDTLIALLIGIIVGALDALFGRVLLAITEFRYQNMIRLLPFLPVAGVFIVLMYRKLNEESMKGMSLIFQTGHGEREVIPKMMVPLLIITTWITHLFGGSAGREGVAVQLGAVAAHNIGKAFRRPDNSRILLITGMAAGFGGLFQTPLAATLFALEVLVAGVIRHEALLPALTAAFVASRTSHLLGLEKFSVNVTDALTWNIQTVWKIVLISFCFGIVGGLFAFTLKKTKLMLGKLIINPVVRIAIMGVILAILMLLLHMGRYTGLGTNLIDSSFSNGSIYSYDWILKFVFTILTLAAGFQGGEVTPLFAIGAALGVLLAIMTGLPVMLVAALGYAAVFGSATNTLLAPMLMGAEIFGPENILYFAIVCSIAYVFNGNQSIYGGQVQFRYFDK
ncbi:chloride channel protein [Parasporobacterium paucivorans]|uniref:H+/Cl-antiporter ClcA n=1 Tax=Parasporobacterium paucivorans DSM 15970 TaxID=1122934 RepID=A0A1M6L9A5_9FIRM|nr:chloride channel protein [Parasporobacterium paucivorans]SHJ67762.1 H+/Cl-antiporter ClcA [Parasporobacterium paucivorans DSM 15970]